MTLGFRPLFDGIEFIVVAMGVFGIAEIIDNLDQREPVSYPMAS